MHSYSKEYRNSIRTCAELTKFNSDMYRTYKIRFGHVQNLQNSIRTCAELTKINSDMCRTYKIGQNTPQNSDKCMRPPSYSYFHILRMTRRNSNVLRLLFVDYLFQLHRPHKDFVIALQDRRKEIFVGPANLGFLLYWSGLAAPPALHCIIIMASLTE